MCKGDRWAEWRICLLYAERLHSVGSCAARGKKPVAGVDERDVISPQLWSTCARKCGGPRKLSLLNYKALFFLFPSPSLCPDLPATTWNCHTALQYCCSIRGVDSDAGENFRRQKNGRFPGATRILLATPAHPKHRCVWPPVISTLTWLPTRRDWPLSRWFCATMSLQLTFGSSLFGEVLQNVWRVVYKPPGAEILVWWILIWSNVRTRLLIDSFFFWSVFYLREVFKRFVVVGRIDLEWFWNSHAFLILIIVCCFLRKFWRSFASRVGQKYNWCGICNKQTRKIRFKNTFLDYEPL